MRCSAAKLGLEAKAQLARDLCCYEALDAGAALDGAPDAAALTDWP